MWYVLAANDVLVSPLQGRGPNTHAFTHALESGHHMFMKLQDGKACSQPDAALVEAARSTPDAECWS